MPPPSVSAGAPEIEPLPLCFRILAENPTPARVIERAPQPPPPSNLPHPTNLLHCPCCLFSPAHPKPSHRRLVSRFQPKTQLLHALSSRCPNQRHHLITHALPTPSITPAIFFTAAPKTEPPRFRDFDPKPDPCTCYQMGVLTNTTTYFPTPYQPPPSPLPFFFAGVLKTEPPSHRRSVL